MTSQELRDTLSSIVRTVTDFEKGHIETTRGHTFFLIEIARVLLEMRKEHVLLWELYRDLNPIIAESDIKSVRDILSDDEC